MLKLRNIRSVCYLTTETELHDQLSQPLCASAQYKAVEIQPADIYVPKISISTDPDYMLYEDYFYDPAWDYDLEDDEHFRWLREFDSSEVFQTLDDTNSLSDLHQELSSININK